VRSERGAVSQKLAVASCKGTSCIDTTAC